MRTHKGWIALDIDGTITDASHHVPKDVARFLQSLYLEGWELIFITGRSFSFGYRALKVFNFPFYLALQNGADILHMPSKRLMVRHYLDRTVVPEIEKMYEGIAEDFIIYTGIERGDFCYYRPHRFSKRLLAHLHKIMPLSNEPWKEVSHFDFSMNERFPLIKCLGEKNEMEKLEQRLQNLSGCACTLIRDPLDHDGVYLNLVTHREATKGKALLHAVKETGLQGKVIAAGDDLNDISMLEVADFKIVMENAPHSMHPSADYLAKSAEEQGIIEALQEAVKACS